ncbi:TRAP transporter small permease subunit [Mangrovicoccus algicola]|uniref:TRAP transporter small permease protein n=1 Tax=Mangrovicoccus algicola TaxID=2771008 RepID=A0A8J6YWU8_9RHOB|nr:TRAP transporter small permease subunit [Mangrovicoccus algicola]MBE3637266.1 TRAP transporter small permease subunit [Mangrovicoccus algicola]
MEPELSTQKAPGALARIDAGLARAELALAARLTGALALVLAAAAVARSLGAPLIWADEAAVGLMCWAAFAGASAALAQGAHVSVSILESKLSPRAGWWRALAETLILAALLGWLASVIWRWLDPAGLWQAGSGQRLAETAFNFVWVEPTVTLGLRKIWLWSVLPLFCLGAGVHLAARLARLAEAAR